MTLLPRTSGGHGSPKHPRARAVLSINTGLPLVALLLIILLAYVAYRPQRADTLRMDRLGWLAPPVGMYAAEQFPGQTPSYRWTSGDATLPLPNPGGAVWLQFTLGGHPGGTPGAAIRVGAERISLDVPTTIRRYRLLLPPTAQERLGLQLVAPPLVIEGDGRSLGLVLGPIKVLGGGRVPDIVMLGAGLLFVGAYLFVRRSGYAPWAITGVLLPIIALALIWNAASGWRYAVVGSTMLLIGALSLAALAYEQLLSKPLFQKDAHGELDTISAPPPTRRRSLNGRLAAIAAAALIGVGLLWGVTRAPDIELIGAALIALVGYIWLRAVGLPRLRAYAGMLLLGIAALLVQHASGIVPMVPGLLLILLSLNWLALDLIPRTGQSLRGRLIADTAWIILSAAVVITVGIDLYIWSQPVVGKPDILYIWRDSVRLATGQNPYERVLAGNMRTNDKYATYFPLFYLLGALVHTLGLQTFDSWIIFWRVVFLACAIGTALLIYILLNKSGRPLLAGVAAAFWLLHRWTLASATSANIDFLSIFFLTLSLALLYSYRSPAARPAGGGGSADQRTPVAWRLWGALLSLSVSLAIKQIAIFLVPLYCIWVWHSAHTPMAVSGRAGWRQTRIMRAAVALLTILSLPLIVALPFLAWNAPGFVLSILFSATRTATMGSSAASASWILGEIFPPFTGIASRLIIVLALLGVYAAAARREVQMFTAGLLTMAVFVGFNPVFFNQYLTWLLPFIALIACDHAPDHDTGVS